VPHPQEKTPEPVTELPNPELNPLLNPTLGRNLGRWAEVYFTSPPEKRQEAVCELLRELNAQPASERAENEGDGEGYVRSNFEASEIPRSQAVQCAECGHRYAGPQRFCGMCGAPLTSEQQGPEDYLLEETIVADSPPAPEPVFAAMPDPARMVAVASPPRSTANGTSEARWLRERNLAAETAPSWSRRARRYAPAALAVVAIGIFIYAQSRPAGSQRQGAPITLAPVVHKTASDPAQGSASAPISAPAPANPERNTRTAASNGVPKPPAPNQATPDENRVPLSSPAANGAQHATANAPTLQPVEDSSTANGSVELARAEDFLTGKRFPRDSAVAAKFLWKAVAKENPSALLLLSDMYLIGDGVPKSCAQARLLLNAAARKNVSQAAEKLRNLQTSGCP
jgi:TPR repeat protein